MIRWTKDPAAVLDYKWDWDDWLATGESIDTKTITAESGLTVDSSTITDTGRSVTVWLSGGTEDTTYEVSCLIETDAGRTDKRTVSITVNGR